jgi:hypothetical protein
MKELSLGRYVITIDDEDFERVRVIKWRASKSKPVRFSARISSGGSSVKTTLERFILSPSDPLLRVERRSGFSANDYRKQALIAVSMQASQAAKPKRNGRYTSKYKGVSRTKSGRWAAHICTNRRSVYIGTYDCEHEAAIAYNAAASAAFGEFSFLNAVVKSCCVR